MAGSQKTSWRARTDRSYLVSACATTGSFGRPPLTLARPWTCLSQTCTCVRSPIVTLYLIPIYVGLVPHLHHIHPLPPASPITYSHSVMHTLSSASTTSHLSTERLTVNSPLIYALFHSATAHRTHSYARSLPTFVSAPLALVCAPTLVCLNHAVGRLSTLLLSVYTRVSLPFLRVCLILSVGRFALFPDSFIS